MNDYPLIKKLGLEAVNAEFFNGNTNVVNAYELENLLQNSTVVYGYKEESGDQWFATDRFSSDTHKALLIAIEPIEEKKVMVARADLEKAYKSAGNLSFFAIAKELGL